MSLPKAPFQSSIWDIGSKVTTVWQQWFDRVQIIINSITGFGATTGRPTNNLSVGQPYFDTTQNTPVWWNGSAWVNANPGSSVVSSVTGTAPIASSGGSTPNISITQATASSSGYLSSADWNTFNNKQPAGTYVNSVSGVSPVVSSGGTNPSISMPAANASTNGYLTSADWLSFNSASSKGFVDVAATYGTSASAIQAAITANPGRTLYFRSGIWNILGTIYINDTCTILGDNPQTSYLFEQNAVTSLPTVGTVFQIASTFAGDAFTVGTGAEVVFQNIGFQPEAIASIKGTVWDYYYLPSSPSVNDKYIVAAPSSLRHPSNPLVNSQNYIWQWNGSSWVSLGNPARSSGTYISVYAGIANQAVNFGTKVFNCHFVFGYYSLFFANAAAFTVSNCYMANTAYVDVYVANGPSSSWQNDYGDSFITNNYMDFWVGYTAGTSFAHVYQVSSGGLKMTGNKFLAGQHHWYINPSSNDINLGFFVGNSAEGASVGPVAIYGGSATGGFPNQIVITGNQLASFGPYAVLIDGQKANNITITSNTLGAASGGYAITLQNGAGGGSGYLSSPSETILIASNQLYGPCGGIAILDTARAYVCPNIINVTGSRFNLANPSNNKYAVGQAQNANGIYNSGYSLYGALYISIPISVSFPTAFPSVPIVNVTLDNPTTVLSAGGVGCLVRNVSTTGFTLYIITVASAGQVNYSFNAYLTGQ